MEENPKPKTKNPIISVVISLAMAVYFLYKGIKYIGIGSAMQIVGILLTICSVALVICAILILCRWNKQKKAEK